jgi:hypothetical protein
LKPLIEVENVLEAFFTRLFQLIRRAVGFVMGIVLWPFTWATRWYTNRGWILRAGLGAMVALALTLYGYFFWNTQSWLNFNPDYVSAYDLAAQQRGTTGPQPAPEKGIISTPQGTASEGPARTCRRSFIVEITADLIDFNVNQNEWISSMILYKLGLFGIDWDHTPFFDNKASFQRGVNQALRRTTIELVDAIGRVRGTSLVDSNLQSARGNLQFDEFTWYFGLNPFGPKTPTPSFYRAAIKDLRTFNGRLEKCDTVFDARADNLLQFIDRIANDLGATSAILRDRSEKYNSGWFDTRADDRFWFAYGQLYGYYGILSGARADFRDVIVQRGLASLWTMLEEQFRAALKIQPFIISNGSEAGWLMPAHLATMGFYVLRVRSNLVEIRLVLDR